MRRCVETWEVARLWISQIQDEAWSRGRRMYFHGSTIYSYGSHFPIAHIMANKKKHRCVLFTCHGYSQTTAKHKREVRNVLGGETLFVVPDVYGHDHRENLEYYERQFKDAADRLVSCTTITRASKLAELDCRVADANAYSAFFGLRKRLAMPKEDQVEAWRKKYMAEKAVRAAETRRQNIIEAKMRPIELEIEKRCSAEDNLLDIARSMRPPGPWCEEVPA